MSTRGPSIPTPCCCKTKNKHQYQRKGNLPRQLEGHPSQHPVAEKHKININITAEETFRSNKRAIHPYILLLQNTESTSISPQGKSSVSTRGPSIPTPCCCKTQNKHQYHLGGNLLRQLEGHLSQCSPCCYKTQNKHQYHRWGNLPCQLEGHPSQHLVAAKHRININITVGETFPVN